MSSLTDLFGSQNVKTFQKAPKDIDQNLFQELRRQGFGRIEIQKMFSRDKTLDFLPQSIKQTLLGAIGFEPFKPEEPFVQQPLGKQTKQFAREIPGAGLEIAKEFGKSAFGFLATPVVAVRDILEKRDPTREVRIPFTKATAPTFADTFLRGREAGLSPLMATVLTTSRAAGDVLIVGLGGQLAGRTVRTAGKLPVERQKIIELTRRDLQDITRGKEFVKQDPLKLDAFKQLEKDGISFIKILKESGKIDVKTGQPKTLKELFNEQAKLVIEDQRGFAKVPEKSKARFDREIVPKKEPGVPVAKITPELEPLVQEASKFETADEFVDELSSSKKHFEILPQSSLKKPTKLYRGEEAMTGLGTGSGAEGFGLYTTTNKKIAKSYADLSNVGVVKEMSLDSIPKNPIYFRGPSEVISWVSKVAKQNFGLRMSEFNEKIGINKLVNFLGHDGVAFDHGSDIGRAFVKYPKTGQTKSQLTDIFNKAKGAVEPEAEVTRALVEVRGKDFTLVGVPKRTGFSPEVRLKREILKVQKERKAEAEARKILEKREQKALLDSIKKGILQGIERQKNQIRKQIGFQRHTKELNGTVLARLKSEAGVTIWKRATFEQLKKILSGLNELKPRDRFLTERQMTGLAEYLKTFDKKPTLVTQREIQKRFKEQDEIMQGFITNKIPNIGFATVDIKQFNDVIRRVVDIADFELRSSTKRIEQVNTQLDKLLTNAEKTSGFSLTNRRNKVGERVFKVMGGEKVNLTTEEQNVVEFLRKYFDTVRKDLSLEKYRKNYITHTEQTFFERLGNNKFDLKKTFQSFINKKTNELPVDILLNLDEIVGSEKFFRFALERKGVIEPSTNIRRITRQYSEIAENKKALDKILPEGQASMQLLLQPKSAKWMKQYLQNLKGRGLDSNFRNGKGGWIAKGADTIIDFGYVRLLGLNLWSGVKNLVGGEANSLVFQTANNYLTGKQRLITRPKKAYRIINNSGLLDSSYVEVVQQNIISKGKKATNLVLYGSMQLAEYEIRGSYFLGELTPIEFKTENISPKRFREILDGISITQGVYSKVDSPLFVQTVLGRSIMQFGRWKLVNSALFRRIAKGAKAEWANKNYTGKNSRSLLKMLSIHALGTYLAYEAGKAGMKQAKKVAEASTEIINVILNLPEEVIRAWTDNPLVQSADSITFSYLQLLAYMGIAEEPRKIRFRSGVEDTYFSALKTLGAVNNSGGEARFNRSSDRSKARFSR